MTRTYKHIMDLTADFNGNQTIYSASQPADVSILSKSKIFFSFSFFPPFSQSSGVWDVRLGSFTPDPLSRALYGTRGQDRALPPLASGSRGWPVVNCPGAVEIGSSPWGWMNPGFWLVAGCCGKRTKTLQHAELNPGELQPSQGRFRRVTGCCGKRTKTHQHANWNPGWGSSFQARQRKK